MRSGVAIGVLAASLVASAGCGPEGSDWTRLWWTPAQEAQRLFDAGEFERAAAISTDPLQRGAALYRAREFEEAAAAFARAGTAAGAFDAGNALVLLGRYPDAIASYDRALELRPEWTAARENRAIAAARQARFDAAAGERTGEASEIGADEVVFDESAQADSRDAETVEVGGGEALSDDELRALWLRRVQTKPADFLRARFAFQAARRDAEGDG